MKPTPVALVTGATSGIGEATAHRLHDRGYRVFAVGRNPQALAALRSGGLQARAVDITDPAAVDALVTEIESEHAAVDVLVNSAGLPLSMPLEQVGLAELRSLFETNVVAMLHLCQAVLPAMRGRRAGTIVNIGSTAGRFTSPGAGPYHMSKYAVEALSLVLRPEAAQFGVRVVLLDPTGVRTRFVSAQLETEPSYPDDDPYAGFKHRYFQTSKKLTATPGLMIDADTVARAVLRVVRAKNPRARHIVGASGRASVLARLLLTDRMWDRVTMRQLRG